MAYTKQDFQPNTTLYASELNDMDDQIALNETNIAANAETIASHTSTLSSHASAISALQTKTTTTNNNVSTETVDIHFKA